MEASEIMTNSEMTEIPYEEIVVETTSIQEVTEELTITELLTSTETDLMTTSTTMTTTECLTYAKLEKLDVGMLNNFTYLGTFFIIFVTSIIVFKGIYRLFNIFF